MQWVIGSGRYCGSLEREEVRGICNLNTLNVGEWIMEWKVKCKRGMRCADVIIEKYS